MITQVFDQQQAETTLSSTGRVLICANEQEVEVTEPVESEDSGEITETSVTKYQYDTLWVKPIKQDTAGILQAFKEARIEEIDAYDTSDSVNSFTLNGTKMWLDRELRIALKTRLLAEQEVGQTTTTIWYDDTNFTMEIESALALLTQLEVYASQCYDITGNHKLAVNNCTTIAEVAAVDITADYPNNPEYTL